MAYRWPTGGRIGVCLRPGSATAALVVDGRSVSQSAIPFDGHDERALTTLLRETSARAKGPVESVAWDLSELLVPTADIGRVAALRVVPREPVSAGLADHPAPLMRALVGHRTTVRGGHDMFGLELAPLDLDGAVRAARAAADAGFTALAITAAGAVGCAEHESAVAESVLDAVPGLRLSLSHEIGGLGVSAREAATVLTAALGPLATELVGRCERSTAAGVRRGASWYVAADGGRVSAERLRTFPVHGLRAGTAAGMLGAAMLSSVSTATVVLAGADGYTSGQVRDGLPHAASDVMTLDGMRLATPQAVLSSVSPPLAPTSPAPAIPDTVVAARDETGTEGARHFADRLGNAGTLVDPAADVVAIGCTATEPSAWLDLVVSADTPQELRRVRGQVEDRACTVVASGGARPGTERVVSSSAVPLSFLRSGSYRVVVRATGRLGGAL
ncbi:hydantoinase/oxoprolinase N-terminal domain-containing protein [Amycolatopsis nigrescens]|uniref:hydantoinase/oxoprolinase N-terminal domain-containing protein n=1 Tax=Amycolatopsis nigrescens TaxID=381445 RepID=UPI000361CF44|nr:hydantoinase/oxoprolinase N-terminal domain-containing protein [Amycolatopsis nigrescens]